MKNKVINALQEEVAMMSHADAVQMQTHIYTMEKLLDILKSEDKVIVDRPVDEIVNKQEEKENRSDSIFDF